MSSRLLLVLFIISYFSQHIKVDSFYSQLCREYDTEFLHDEKYLSSWLCRLQTASEIFYVCRNSWDAGHVWEFELDYLLQPRVKVAQIQQLFGQLSLINKKCENIDWNSLCWYVKGYFTQIIPGAELDLSKDTA